MKKKNITLHIFCTKCFFFKLISETFTETFFCMCILYFAYSTIVKKKIHRWNKSTFKSEIHFKKKKTFLLFGRNKQKTDKI